MNEITNIVILTLRICFMSTILSSLIAIPIGLLLGLFENRLNKFLRPLFTAFTGIPPVIAGVVVYLLYSNVGIFGKLKWLYTTKTIVIAQMIIVIPIIASHVFPAVDPIRKDFWLTSIGMGLSKTKMLVQLTREIAASILAAVIAGFGRAIAEVGAVMIVGGNIRFKTRVITSAIVLETNKGNYQMALRLGIVLIIISLAISFIAMYLSKGARRDSIK
ncbi:MAG: ABC transporter permease [Clostridiaceae bacterium]|jgi:tungstate transport system permease protein|nr:ABC transporter permease [Bacillota bacterium]NLN52382.1 ABC transporter permease [Clostridiaceae bacterium]